MAILPLSPLIASARHWLGFGHKAANRTELGGLQNSICTGRRGWRFVAISLLVASSCSGWPTFAADSKIAAVADFHQLCLATRANQAQAFDLADKAGWKATPSSIAKRNVALVGNPNGRVINSGTAQFRIVAAGISGADKKIKTCVIVSGADFQTVAVALKQEFGAAQQSPEMWGWTIAEFGGRRKLVSKESDLTSRPDRLYQVFSYSMGKDGSIIRLDELPV